MWKKIFTYWIVLFVFNFSIATTININSATEKELQTLKGIGEVKARAIVAYREKYGYFMNIEEIMKVSGIGFKTYWKNKDQLSVTVPTDIDMEKKQRKHTTPKKIKYIYKSKNSGL